MSQREIEMIRRSNHLCRHVIDHSLSGESLNRMCEQVKKMSWETISEYDVHRYHSGAVSLEVWIGGGKRHEMCYRASYGGSVHLIGDWEGQMVRIEPLDVERFNDLELDLTETLRIKEYYDGSLVFHLEHYSEEGTERTVPVLIPLDSFGEDRARAILRDIV